MVKYNDKAAAAALVSVMITDINIGEFCAEDLHDLNKIVPVYFKQGAKTPEKEVEEDSGFHFACEIPEWANGPSLPAPEGEYIVDNKISDREPGALSCTYRQFLDAAKIAECGELPEWWNVLLNNANWQKVDQLVWETDSALEGVSDEIYQKFNDILASYKK